jgi:hypothetical protein
MKYDFNIPNYYQGDSKEILLLVINKLKTLNSNIGIGFIDDGDDFQKYDRDQKLGNILGENKDILTRLSYSLECGNPHDFNLYGITTNKLIFHILDSIISEVSKYNQVHFPPTYLTMEMINGKNIINFYLYIDLYEAKKI